MRIAVNTRHWTSQNMNGEGYYIRHVFTIMANDHPKDTFYFIFQNPGDVPTGLPENVISIILPLKRQGTFSLKWWFDVKIPLLLKKIKADVFVSCEGFSSLTTSKPQVMVVPNLAFLQSKKQNENAVGKLKRKHASKLHKKAGVIVTTNEINKHSLVEKLKTDPAKVINAGLGVNPNFQPAEWTEREEIKQDFSGGYEYFLFPGGNHSSKNVINVLKAFSIFKKWQKSSMKLVIAGKTDWKGNDLLTKLPTYKHRDDVILTGYLPEHDYTRLLAGAYALVYPVFSENFNLTNIDALYAHVPVITSEIPAIKSQLGEAALFTNPNDPEEIAGQMKRIFKDENLRSKIIEAGKIKVGEFNWNTTSDKVYKAIQLAVSK